MTQVASPRTVATPLDGIAVTTGYGQYRFSVENDEIWVEFRDPDAPGPDGSRPRIRRRIVMTTGSHHFQAYWYEAGDSDRSLRILDAAYVIDTDRWMYIGSVFLKPPGPMPGVLRTLERLLHSLPFDPRQSRARSGGGFRFRGGGVRHRLRVLPRSR